ncbi:epoxide hydrolase [Aspergillus flavus]|uniref:Epoxide hydrolase n=1 Tax=Aspergillus flavus TaxID=5059 RepID=A0AB74BXH0_ASPFL|nr:epoxide hydrolase [Aspergillus flavus]
MTSPEIREFTVKIPRERGERLKRKPRDTRLPGQEIVPGAGTRYGPEYNWTDDLYEKWTDGFDWYFVQDKINEPSHYIGEFEAVQIHFRHSRSKTANAIPLLLIHWWPAVFYEFSRVWGPMLHPVNENEQALHVVVPSVPGFCCSNWPPKAGWTLQDTVRLFDSVMKKLGYNEYMVQCGGTRHFVGRELGMRCTPSCKLIHFNFIPSEMPNNAKSWTEREHAIAERKEDRYENHLGYAVCMRTRPHTIRIGLHDKILIMPSTRCFSENLPNEEFVEFTTDFCSSSLKVRFGYSSFLGDTEHSSKRMVEMTGKVVYHQEHDNGGHFAALECPGELVQDVRELAAQELEEVAYIID